MLRISVKNAIHKLIFNRPLKPPPSSVTSRNHSKHSNEATATLSDAELWGEDPDDPRPLYKPEKEPRELIEPELKEKPTSSRLIEFRKKLKEDMENPAEEDIYSQNLMVPKKDDPMPPWPNNTNPHTGEVGGPKGLEPTRYGDWERKGICIDF